MNSGRCGGNGFANGTTADNGNGTAQANGTAASDLSAWRTTGDGGTGDTGRTAGEEGMGTDQEASARKRKKGKGLLAGGAEGKVQEGTGGVPEKRGAGEVEGSGARKGKRGRVCCLGACLGMQEGESPG